MALSKEEVERVALLARLELSEEMAAKMAAQLNQVLDYVAKLNELDTSRTEPMSHPGAPANVFRDDTPTGSEVQESLERLSRLER